MKLCVIRMIKSRMMRWDRTCSLLGREKCIHSCGGKLKLKRPFGRIDHTQDNNIKWDIKRKVVELD
jgi:hypothetical protein